MIVRNDCVEEGTMTVEVNGVCVSPTQLSINDDLLNQIIQFQEKCCYEHSKYLLYITQTLENHSKILQSLLKCCNYIGPINPTKPNVIPGQIVLPARQVNNNIPIPKPQPKPVREVVYENYETPFIPNGSIIDIPSQFFVNGDRYTDKSGTDLMRYLPYELNIKNGDVVLEAILDYRIVDGGGLYPRKEVILVYQTRNLKNRVKTTFEAGVNHYRSWYKIHSNGEPERPGDSSMYRRGVIV